MYIKTLRLRNYRNIKACSVDFLNGINIIYGDNGQGKTNVVEAIFLCTTGRSHRTRIEKELIAFGEKGSNVCVFYEKSGFHDNIEVILINGERKGITVNGRSLKKTGEIFGELQTVIFSPEDLSIVNNGPYERRRFMDMQICQISKIYYYNLHTYFRVLRQRNSILKQKEVKNHKENISVWDEQLISHGKEIMKARSWFIDNINPLACKIHSMLTGEKELLSVGYKPNTDLSYYEEKLRRNVDKDIIYGSTSVGPHKDDIIFSVNGREAKTYGSQGQKRTVALSLRLAEVEIIENETKDSPVLLLDDVFSELDSSRQKMLIEYLTDKQTIITATGMDDLVDKIKSDAKVFYVLDGNMTEVTNEQK